MNYTLAVMHANLVQDLKNVAQNKRIIKVVINAELIQVDSNVANIIQSIQAAMFVNYPQEANYVVMLIQKMILVLNA